MRLNTSFGEPWRALYRDEAMRLEIATDVHAPSEYRVNGVVRNHDAWYTAFDIKEGDPVKETGRIIEVPVGKALMGRVVKIGRAHV